MEVFIGKGKKGRERWRPERGGKNGGLRVEINRRRSQRWTDGRGMELAAAEGREDGGINPPTLPIRELYLLRCFKKEKKTNLNLFSKPQKMNQMFRAGQTKQDIRKHHLSISHNTL